MTRVFIGPTGGGGSSGVQSFNGRSGIVVPTSGDYAVGQVTGAAPLASPALTGTPTAPTQVQGNNSTRIATTAYADAAAAAAAVKVAPTDWLGLGSNSAAGFGVLNFWAARGLSLDRQEFVQPAAAPLANIATARANGMTRIVFVIELSSYNTAAAFPTNGTTLSAFASYFVASLQTIENANPGAGFMYEITNEPWEPAFWATPATPTTYAALVLSVLNACQTAGLDLTRIYPMVKDQSWPAAMITAQPTLSSLIKGWSIHPYGSAPPGFGSTTTQGIAAVPFFREQLATGASNVGAENILISEIGIHDKTVDGATSATDEEAALDAAHAITFTRQVVQQAAQYRAAGWLQGLIWYSRNDGGWAANAVGGALTNVGVGLATWEQPVEQFTTGVYAPGDDGYEAVSMEPLSAQGAVQLAAGKLHLFRIRLDARSFAQTFPAFVDTAGVTLTSAQCFACIYDALGNRLSTSVDQSGNWTSSGRKPNTFAASNNFKPGYYWIGLLANGTTMPKFRGVIVADQANFGNGGALPSRSMLSVTSYTTPPATITLTAGGAGGVSALGSSILIALSSTS